MKKETKSNTTFSKEEVAIIDATFRLYEIVILHRAYKRGRGPNQFTKSALTAAREALTHLRPPTPGADPVQVVARFARQHDIAKAGIVSAIEEASKAKQETWRKIRNLELNVDDLKGLSDEAPIFKMYRSVMELDRTIKELSQPDLTSKAANLVCRLVDRAREASKRTALVEASNG